MPGAAEHDEAANEGGLQRFDLEHPDQRDRRRA